MEIRSAQNAAIGEQELRPHCGCRCGSGVAGLWPRLWLWLWHGKRFCPVGIDLEKPGFQRLGTKQVGLKLKAFALTVRDLAQHLCHESGQMKRSIFSKNQLCYTCEFQNIQIHIFGIHFFVGVILKIASAHSKCAHAFWKRFQGVFPTVPSRWTKTNPFQTKRILILTKLGTP